MSAPRWQNRSPGDLSLLLPEVEASPVEPVLEAAHRAAVPWRRTPIEERVGYLREAKRRLTEIQDELAMGIAVETGKPITEARGEVGAVLAKFDFTFSDAEEHLGAATVTGGPHPALVRHAARGPAAVVAPFNFPLHLGNGALLAYLVAGNPVIFKPSPLAAVVAGRYAAILQECLPPGVFSLVQGGGEEARSICLDPRVRAVCFTGSVAVGRQLAQALAADFSKDLALELGGRNAAIVCADADLSVAARAVADAIGLTCGQRCNSTSRILVDHTVLPAFEEHLRTELSRWIPGDPRDEQTKLGPLVNEAAVQRYASLLNGPADWLWPGEVVGAVQVGELKLEGYYVRPAVRRTSVTGEAECFVPVADLDTFVSEEEAVAKANGGAFGLTASIFTRSRARFERMGDELRVGNLYANLPTTFSPSSLPFGGWGESGNGRPGGRGFVRFCAQEQAVQHGPGLEG